MSSGNPLLRLNGDSGSNYSYHSLYGNGTSALAEGLASQSSIGVGQIAGDNSANVFGASVIDILDYSVTSKNTTVRSLGGSDRNGAGSMRMQSGCWLNTSAVTTITLVLNTGDWGEYSTAALYGIRA